MSEHEDMKALPADIAAMLVREASHLDAPGSDVEARLWSKLGPIASGGSGPSGDGGAGAVDAAKPIGSSLAGKIAPYLATLVGGAAIGAAVHAELGAPKVVVVERDRPMPSMVASAAVPRPTAVLPSIPVDTLPTVAAVVPSAPSAVPSSDTFVAERKLLDGARFALASGDTQLSLARIDEHTRTYPRGRFIEEREALRVRALADAGRKDEARASAERFEAKWPNSVLLPAVKAATQ